jgi:type II secretory ATPase GspE/PulE/Tfp pilus assembly ATPase PilB-like protein
MVDDARQIDEQNTSRRAQILNMQYLNTATLDQKPLFKDVLTLQELYSLRMIPIRMTQQPNNILFGVTTNTSQTTMTGIRQRFADYQTSFVLISDTGYRDYMKLYDPPKEVVYQDIQITGQDEKARVDAISATLAQVRSDDMLAFIVQQAFKLKASDIHLETFKEGARIRFRVDGVLHPIATLSIDKYRQLSGALASAANISTGESQAQTGQINKTYSLADGSSITVNLRVEAVTAIHGMDAVLRLFNFKPEMLHLDKLGLEEYEQESFRDIIKHPSGLVLIVGPTGSGKSTTLYTLINELNHPERKIITLEDPVEYQIEGITQIPIDTRTGASFAEGLRAVLRLDPDVVMVGEIRDTDTAKTALQASLTGHLVLSTYHASSAAAAMTRMLDAMGENPLFISAIRLIQAQRLCRRLDDQTKVEYRPDEALKVQLARVFAEMPAGVKTPNVNDVVLYRPGSTPERPFGYDGQIALRELMLMDEGLITLLKKPKNELTATEIERKAVEDGRMLTMLHDGVLKALEGKTSLEEVYRVVG